MTQTNEPSLRTVLVADDDPDLVALMMRRLTRAGFRVITALDGEQALELAERCLPQVAVLDVMMPKLTGIDVMEVLHAREATRDIPVILISAGPREPAGHSARSGEADEYVRKPFGPHELRNRVEAVLAR